MQNKKQTEQTNRTEQRKQRNIERITFCVRQCVLETMKFRQMCKEQLDEERKERDIMHILNIETNTVYAIENSRLITILCLVLRGVS